MYIFVENLCVKLAWYEAKKVKILKLKSKPLKKIYI